MKLSPRIRIMSENTLVKQERYENNLQVGNIFEKLGWINFYLKFALERLFSRVNPDMVSVICRGGKCLAAIRMRTLKWAFASVDS